MSKSLRYKFIINPNAGRGKARNIKVPLEDLLRSKNVEFDIAVTADALDAIELAHASANEYDVIVAVGGDGTAHEVANGIIGTKTALGVLPIGSGNDFANVVGMKANLDDSIGQLLANKQFTIDTGSVECHSSNGAVVHRRFINSVGIGFDAIVAYESQRIKHLKGIPLYLVAIFRSLRQLTSYRFSLTIGGKDRSGELTLVCIGNGNREGGGFFVTPGAKPDDGTFEVCTVQKVGLARALRILPTILSGTHGKFKEVAFANATDVTAQSMTPQTVHADGEIIGRDIVKTVVGMEGQSLLVVHG